MELNELLCMKEPKVFFISDNSIQEGVIKRIILEWQEQVINVISVDVEKKTIDKEYENVNIENFKCDLSDISNDEMELKMKLKNIIDEKIAMYQQKLIELDIIKGIKDEINI